MSLKTIFIQIKSFLCLTNNQMNDFYIGFLHIIIIETHENGNAVIFDKLLAKLLNLNISILWLDSYDELELMDEFIEERLKETLFVIIG